MTSTQRNPSRYHELHAKVLRRGPPVRVCREKGGNAGKSLSMTVRALLGRVRRLELGRQPNSPFILEFGSLEAFATYLREGVDEDIFDRRDIIGTGNGVSVLNSVLRWHSSGIWRH